MRWKLPNIIEDIWIICLQSFQKIPFLREFPDHPVVRLYFHCQGPGLDPWSGNFLGGASGKKKKKNLPANTGDEREAGLIPGSGRSPGGRYGSSLQCSCLENPMVRAIVHGVVTSWTWLKWLSMHAPGTKTPQGTGRSIEKKRKEKKMIMSLLRWNSLSLWP